MCEISSEKERERERERERDDGGHERTWRRKSVEERHVVALREARAVESKGTLSFPLCFCGGFRWKCRKSGVGKLPSEHECVSVQELRDSGTKDKKLLRRHGDEK